MRDVQPKNDSPTGTKEAGSLRYENTRASHASLGLRNAAQEPQRCAFFRCGHTLCSVWYQQWNTSTRPLYRWIHVWFSQQRPLSEWIARFFSHPAELLTICHLFSVWLYYDTTLPYASNKHPLLQTTPIHLRRLPTAIPFPLLQIPVGKQDYTQTDTKPDRSGDRQRTVVGSMRPCCCHSLLWLLRQHNDYPAPQWLLRDS